MDGPGRSFDQSNETRPHFAANVGSKKPLKLHGWIAVLRVRSHVEFHVGSGHGLLKLTAHDCSAIGIGGNGGAGGAGIGSGGT